MDGHQEARHQRQSNTVKNVKPKQRRLTDKTSAEQSKSRITLVVDKRNISQLQESRTRSFITRKRRGSGHVAAYRDCPDGQLIPRKQVTSEAQQQCQYEKNDADIPIELARRF